MTCFKASGVYENSQGRTRGRRGAANELKLFEMVEDHLVSQRLTEPFHPRHSGVNVIHRRHV